MSKKARPYTSEATAMAALARAIRHVAQTDGDHTTAIPALTLHRRKAPTEPLHCIYNLGLGVVAQGDKQVLLGGEAIDCGPGQSMLTTIDLPVVSHVTRASVREPFLGMMLTLDVRAICTIARTSSVSIMPRNGSRTLARVTCETTGRSIVVSMDCPGPQSIASPP